jgi:hypothetical protein
MLIEPIQLAPQAIVIEILRFDARTQQMLDRLVLKKLRDQVQPSETLAQSVQDHGDSGRPHTDLPLRSGLLRIHIRCQPDLLARSSYNAQVVQALTSIRFGLVDLRVPPPLSSSSL